MFLVKEVIKLELHIKRPFINVILLDREYSIPANEAISINYISGHPVPSRLSFPLGVTGNFVTKQAKTSELKMNYKVVSTFIDTVS